MGLDPVVLFFVFGLAAGLLKSELKLPPALYDTLSIVLLLAIGLHGGVELAEQAKPPAREHYQRQRRGADVVAKRAASGITEPASQPTTPRAPHMNEQQNEPQR